MLELGKMKHPIVGIVVCAGFLLAAMPALAKLPFKKAPCTSFVASEAWQAYVHTDKGERCAVTQPVEAMADKSWMFLRFTDYSGPRIRLVVMPISNRSGYQAVPIDALEDMLATALFNTNRMELLEREELGSTLREQDFGASGRVSPETAPSKGKIMGAEYQIHASVIEWTPVKNKTGTSVGKRRRYWGRKTGGGFSKSKAEVAMAFRVVDATTSSVLHSVTVRANSTSFGLDFGGLTGGLLSGAAGFEKNSPISYAVQAAMGKASYQLAHWLKKRPWRGSVVTVDGNTLVLNAGSDRGIEPGMMMSVLEKGEEQIDPENGTSIGARTRVIGMATVTTVDQRWSEAVIVDGCKGVKRGDRIEMADDDAIPRANARADAGAQR